MTWRLGAAAIHIFPHAPFPTHIACLFTWRKQKKAAGMWFWQQLIIERRISALWGAEITVALDVGTNTDILPCSYEGSKSKFSCTWLPHGSKWTPSLCCCQPLKLKSWLPGLTKSLQLYDHCVHDSVAPFCFALFMKGQWWTWFAWAQSLVLVWCVINHKALEYMVALHA